jgi:L-ascorbate metabolism protein UlaG (beta-lactamase superfamily)
LTLLIGRSGNCGFYGGNMKIKHFLYNSFIIENEEVKIAIDPGRNLLWSKLNSLIPRSQWEGITHILITHGDIDHFVYAIPVAKETGAKVVCGEELKKVLLSDKIEDVHAIDVGEVVDLEDFKVEGLKVRHGPFPIRLLSGLIEIENTTFVSDHGGIKVFLGPIKIIDRENAIRVQSHGVIKVLFGLIRLEKDNVDFAHGSMGFKIDIDNKVIVNLGDSLLQKEWDGLYPDILMIPIGGGMTMDLEEALDAVRSISPKKVIPCHYNNDLLWQRKVNPADDQLFKREVEKMGIECIIMKYGDEINV